jgi:RNA polymerase sigma factor (TIGR02999 family)
MDFPSGADVTKLLLAWGSGEEEALEQLIPLVHQELHRIAKRHMRGQRPGHTLQTTALVNEAYMRLVDLDQVQWQDRAHFFAVSARLMRRILVDSARSRGSLKRGGAARRVILDEASIVSPQPSEDLIELNEALNALARIDPRKERVVELRFFGGLSVRETAEVVRVSAETVKRDWKLAKAWLLRELDGMKADGSRTMETD